MVGQKSSGSESLSELLRPAPVIVGAVLATISGELEGLPMLVQEDRLNESLHFLRMLSQRDPDYVLITIFTFLITSRVSHKRRSRRISVYSVRSFFRYPL